MGLSLTAVFAAAAAGAALLLCTGCAAPPSPQTSADDAPLVHEYRTGSLIAKKEKQPVTEEERQQAKAVADEIRASQRSTGGRQP